MTGLMSMETIARIIAGGQHGHSKQETRDSKNLIKRVLTEYTWMGINIEQLFMWAVKEWILEDMTLLKRRLQPGKEERPYIGG